MIKEIVGLCSMAKIAHSRLHCVFPARFVKDSNLSLTRTYVRGTL